jgi:hypothetical protein
MAHVAELKMNKWNVLVWLVEWGFMPSLMLVYLLSMFG